MPKIVACMRVYDAVEFKVSKVANTLSEELVEAIFYSYIKYRTEALKELPTDSGSPLEGPQSIKEMFQSVKLELQDLAHKMGEQLVAGMAKSFAENMPFRGAARPAAALLDRPQDALLAMIPSRKSVIDMIMGERLKGSRLLHGAMEVVEEEDENPMLQEEIRAIEQELEKINTESRFAQDIRFYERCLWQSVSLRKRIWLYVFHMSNFFWNAAEAEKSRSNNDIVRMILWVAGAIFSGFELRKSASYRNILSFYCYTPERFGLTVMKISLIAFFILQFAFLNTSELTHVGYVEKLLEKMIFSILGSTLVSIGALTLLNRGYGQKIEKRKVEMAEHKSRLHELLDARVALLKKA